MYAALDLGTNNCRLLIARPTRDGFRVVDAFSRIVRLGEGLGRSGHLSEQAMARTIEALKICAGKMRRRGVTRVQAVATEACRNASNVDEFIARVSDTTGIDLAVISSAEEAGFAVAGCAPLLEAEGERALVFDIGGGSTELIWLDLAPAPKPEIIAWTSLPCGVVNLAEDYGGHDVSRDTYEAMVAEVAARLVAFEQENGIREAVCEGRAQLLGTSGTVTTIAGVQLGLKRYDRARVDGTWLARSEIISISRALAGMTYEERAANGCVGRDRADLVVAGCAILEGIIGLWPADRLRVADRGLREGMLMGMIDAADGERLARSGASPGQETAANAGMPPPA